MTATTSESTSESPPEALPSAPEPRRRDGHWGWTGPLLVTAVAAMLRFWQLDRPAQLMVDETYYAKDAWALIKTGAGRQWPEGVDEDIIAGLDVPVPEQASFVVHPEVGKWVIGAGEQLFGLTPVGWRVGVALLGTLTVLVLARAARRLTGSTLLGCVAGLLLALDGLSITLSRAAFLDSTLTFLIVAAFACLLLDRDRSMLRGWRPWRVTAGVLLGLTAGTKWSGAFALAAFGLLTVSWEAAARAAVSQRGGRWRSLLVDAPRAFLAIVPPAIGAYLLSWIGWITSDDGWSRQWATSRPASGLAAVVPDWLRSLWHYHAEMLDFHRNLSTPHDYESSPWGWLALTRPFLLHYEDPCGGSQCSQTVLALGTPAIWWPGIAALAVTVWLWAARRDWRAGAVLAGVAGTYLPWFLFPERTAFSWYVVTTAPFVALALTLVAGLMLGPAGASARRRAVGAAAVGAYLLVVVASAAYFWPLWSAEVIPFTEWQDRMWLPRWV